MGQKTPLKLNALQGRAPGTGLTTGLPYGRNRSRAHPPAYTLTPSQQSEKGANSSAPSCHWPHPMGRCWRQVDEAETPGAMKKKKTEIF